MDSDRTMTTPLREVRPTRDKAVFVDRSGRRRRMAVVVGSALATILVASLVLLVVAVSGASNVHIPGFPDVGHQAGAGDSTPSPTVPADPVLPQSPPRTGGALAGGARTPSPTATSAPSASATKRGRQPT